MSTKTEAPPTPEERAQKIAEAVESYELTANLTKDIASAIRAAVEAEREACAVIAEVYDYEHAHELIRARGAAGGRL